MIAAAEILAALVAVHIDLWPDGLSDVLTLQNPVDWAWLVAALAALVFGLAMLVLAVALATRR
ncbi:MAG TPA: hypothetical protein VFG47_08445 [Geminicoccaceae bacterium]|nr:hypothetical protein [Geminicoccaceae bacterium]